MEGRKETTPSEKADNYGSQLKLTLLNLLGETPNFIALLISAITTKTIIVFVDLIDTAGNILRNILVVLISRKLRKNLKFQYNYGVGKIEALSSMFCDFFMIISLLVMLGFAIKDIISPRPAEGFMFFVVAVKILNVSGDVFVYLKQRKICKNSDSLVMHSSLSVAFKNLIFDITSFTAIILIAIFGNRKIMWYISPVVSIVLGGYLLYVTIKRLAETIWIVLDRSANEEIQVIILQTLSSFYDKYDTVKNIQSHISGGVVIIDLDLGFRPEMTYKEIKDIADGFSKALSEKIPKCEVSLKIKGINNNR